MCWRGTIALFIGFMGLMDHQPSLVHVDQHTKNGIIYLLDDIRIIQMATLKLT